MNILLIDGKNTVYRSVFAARNNMYTKCHPFVVWLRLTNTWINKFKPSSIHVFWDCPKDLVWRKSLYKEYKNNRDSMIHYSEDIQNDVALTVDAATKFLSNMNVRQYKVEFQESDDLIYSACKILTPTKTDDNKIIIISSDSDFVQIQWAMPHVSVYDPRKNEFMEQPDADPVIQKVLCGDKADNIEGYRGIGPIKSNQLAKDKKKLFEFLDAVGDEKFKANMALVDMSLNPNLLLNELYVMRTMISDINFNSSIINNLIVENKIKGLMADYPKLITSYKNLV